ncbi:MAG: hypothetical protein R3F60_26625 [bacterium]
MASRSLVQRCVLLAACGGWPAHAAEVDLDESVFTRVAQVIANQIDEVRFSDLRFQADPGRLMLHGDLAIEYRPRPIPVIWDACRPPLQIQPVVYELPPLFDLVAFNDAAYGPAEDALLGIMADARPGPSLEEVVPLLAGGPMDPRPLEIRIAEYVDDEHPPGPRAGG